MKEARGSLEGRCHALVSMSLQLGPESEPRALDWEGSEPTTSLMSVVKCGVFP